MAAEPINIVYWNANGLLNKLLELPYLVNKFDIDFLMINETKLTHTNKCYLQGYTCYRKYRNRVTHGGGVVIFAKNSLQHSEFPINTKHIEAHGIKIPGNILLVSAYCPPQIKIQESDLVDIFKLNNKVLLAGDLNSKHAN